MFDISLYYSCYFIPQVCFQVDFVNSMRAAQEFSEKVSRSLKVKRIYKLVSIIHPKHGLSKVWS